MRRRLSTTSFLAGLLCFYLMPVICGADIEAPQATVATNAPQAIVATNAPQATTATNAPAEPNETEKAVIASLRLQEQLHTTLLAIELARAEAAAAARTNADALAARLESIQQSLTAQREREMHAAQKSTQAMLIASGVFAGVGMLALLVTAWFQLRGMSRLAEMASAPPTSRVLAGMPATAMLAAGDSDLDSAESTGARLYGLIDRLEKRIHELEDITQSLPAGESSTRAPRLIYPGQGAHPADNDQLSLLLGKGQALLNLGQAESALACFDAVLAQDPKHTEALLKKGGALDRLNRLEESLSCYDRALAADPNLTQAHLAKGGVYNQLERFNEALECYERALRTQRTVQVGP